MSDSDADLNLPAFDGTLVGAVDSGTVGEILLRNTGGFAVTPDNAAKEGFDLSFHAERVAILRRFNYRR